jgi:hypothetical protein
MQRDISKMMMEQFVELCNDEARFRCAKKVSSYCHKRALMMLAYAQFGTYVMRTVRLTLMSIHVVHVCFINYGV